MRSAALPLALVLALTSGCILQQRATLGPAHACTPSVGATWSERPYYDALADGASRAGFPLTGFGVVPSLAALDPGMMQRYGVSSVDAVEYR